MSNLSFFYNIEILFYGKPEIKSLPVYTPTLKPSIYQH